MGLSGPFLYKLTLIMSLSGPFLYKLSLIMGLSGLEPPTSRLSGVRSNRLSYRPIPAWHDHKACAAGPCHTCVWVFVMAPAATCSPMPSPA